MCHAAVLIVGRDDGKKSHNTGRGHRADRKAPGKWHLERAAFVQVLGAIGKAVAGSKVESTKIERLGICTVLP